MKFSLKTLVAAVAMAAAASGASAAINNGANDGQGELFFSAFDGASSYSFDLNLSITGFDSAMSTAGLYNGSWGAADGFSTSFNSWLSTANTSSLEWNILATDTAGARRILSTVGTTLPANNLNASLLRTGAGNIQTTLNAINQNADIVSGGNSAVSTIGTAAYAGTMGGFYTKFNFDTTGTTAANSYDNGLTFQMTTAGATGTALGANTAFFDESVAVRAWIGSDHALHIGAVAAVPEPESYAMLLAGLGMLGFMARRRLNNRI